MSQMPTLGSPVPAEIPQAVNMGEIQAQIANAQRQQQLAALLMQQGYVPNSGAVGAIAQIVSGWKAGKLDRRADETIAQALKRKFEEENRIQADEARRAADAEEAKYVRGRRDKREDMLTEASLRAGDNVMDANGRFWNIRNGTAYPVATGRAGGVPQMQPPQTFADTDPAPPSGPMDRGTAMSYVQQAEAANGSPFPVPVRMQMIQQLMTAGRFDANNMPSPSAPPAGPQLVGRIPNHGGEGGSYSMISPEEIQQLGLPQGTVAQRGPSGQVQIINKPRDLPSGGQVIDNGDGTTTYIPAGKLSEGERNAAGFYQRMTSASKELDALNAAGYDPTNLRDYMNVGGKYTNIAATSEGQQYHQAAMNWVRANLRKESGAAIGVAEAEQEIRNYFPQFGDSKEVIAQKTANRRVVEQAMRTAAGAALAPLQQPNAPATKPAPSAAPAKPGDYSHLWSQ